MKSHFALLSLTLLAVVAFAGHPLLALCALAVLSATWARPVHGRLCVTLISTEILADVIVSFKKQLPLLNMMGLDFSPQSFKLNQTYIAHIPGIPTVEDVTTTYATTGQNARDLITDVPITVDKRRGCRLKIQHLDRIKDNKELYGQIIGNAGYALAKDFVDDIFGAIRSRNFSQFSTFTEANSDLDMLEDVREHMNVLGADPVRNMFVNSAVATVLGADSRIASKDYAGQMPDGTALRRFRNIGGFQQIIEYPDFPLNNGTALTGVTAETTDIFTKTAHGLVTGDRVLVSAFTSLVATGVTIGTTYVYIIKIDADTFKVASTLANAAAGTAIDVTTAGTSGTLTPSENLIAFGFDRRALAVLAGIPDGFDSSALKAQYGIPDNMGFEAVTYEGITMGAVSWEDTGTGDLTYMPVLVYGKALGRQAGSNAAGQKTDYAGYRVIKA